jgi:hypothetical protein
MSINEKTLRGYILGIVKQELRYYKHYIGQVRDTADKLNKGRVLVTIPILGWDSPEKGAWCFPRQMHSLSVPAVDEWVEVYFLNGDPNRPVYMGISAEIQDMIPDNYSSPDIDILFEDPENKINVQYDRKADIMTIGKGDHMEAARKEDETLSDSSIDSAFFNWLATHTHTSAGSGSPTTPPIQPAPTSQTGKINSGSSQVKIGDK